MLFALLPHSSIHQATLAMSYLRRCRLLGLHVLVLFVVVPAHAQEGQQVAAQVDASHSLRKQHIRIATSLLKQHDMKLAALVGLLRHDSRPWQAAGLSTGIECKQARPGEGKSDRMTHRLE